MTSMVVLFGSLLALALASRLFALSGNALIEREVNTESKVFPVAAGEHIYRGALVGRDPAGFLKSFVPGDRFVGVAYEECDNSSGDAGAAYCRVFVEGDFQFTLTGAALADLGKPAYATADDALALTGHADAYVGRIVSRPAANTVVFRLKAPGEVAPNGQGSIVLELTGQEAFAATGATAGDECVNGFELESILGLGVTMNDAEGGGIKLAFDNTAEVALNSIRTPNDCLPVDKGITFEAELVVSDKGDDAALDIDFGLGTALTTNSEANIDHTDMVNLACFHLDGNSDNILAQSDDNTTDVAPVDTEVDNDSTTDVPKKFQIIVRPTGAVEFWIDGARVLPSTTFAVSAAAVLAAFVNMEKTSNDTTAEIILYKLRVAGGAAA